MCDITKLMELRPNKSLLKPDFDGYKLSLAKIPTVTHHLKVPVNRNVPDISQYSLLHAKTYALYNHLIGESSDTKEAVFFFNKEFNLIKCTIDSITNQLLIATIWKLPIQKESSLGTYDVSMKLLTDKIAVVADGQGYLYILDREAKDIQEYWTIIFSSNVTGPQQNFLLKDALYCETPKVEINLLLTTINRKDDSPKYSTVLHWITLEKTDTWKQVALRQLTVDGFVQYANFERPCNAVYVISESSCKFTLDTQNEVKIAEENKIQFEKKYKWTQGSEYVKITYPLFKNINKNLLNVNTEPKKISIIYNKEVLLEGNLCHRIDASMTIWNLEYIVDKESNGTILNLVLQKCEIGLMWSEVIESDTQDYVADPNLVAANRLPTFTNNEEFVPPSGIIFNSQQVEACDFEYDKMIIFERLCRNSHEVTHKINLGSQVLLTVNLGKFLPLALATRSDVDTLIWQPNNNGKDFFMEHKGTLFALGYVQASKQKMKYFVCAPDLSYCVISESTKHLFIYCQNKTITSNELKNRSTGRKINTVSQQQVFNLPTNDEILGLFASNSYLYVLGENLIMALKI